ncbi:HNH endonuclease [Flavobacterium ginsengiterrae]|uniref:HNH domain-containing protein n=1 Tax=Flavobacterium ginsengiterrae TaxID=871695 RepID=A0ABP7HBI7_9FLAO
MSNIIVNPYNLTLEEQKIIGEKFKTHTDWDTSDNFDEIKKNIRDFLRIEQDNKCCYCKRELGFDIKEVDIEHIIAKSLHWKFTFEPLNLALSCPGCNTKKGDTNILAKSIVRYPKNSKNVTIIHAHYDKYDENINIIDNCIFEPISKKGSHTITVCELFRIKIAEKKAKEVIVNRSPESKLIDLIVNAPADQLSIAFAELMKRIK